MSQRPKRRVAIVGGGITGLSAAYELSRDPHLDVTVLESSTRSGGKILTGEIEGSSVDLGADWFVTRNKAALELCSELGLADQLVEPRRLGAYVLLKNRLRKLPQALVRGVPLFPSTAVRARVLSPAGALRCAADLTLPGPLAGADISVGALVRRRFGTEVLDSLVDPMMSAARAGHPDDLSLAAAAPELDAVARSNRSVLRGLRAGAGRASPSPPFLGLRGGMESLVSALFRHLGSVPVRTDARVATIEAGPGGYRVITPRGPLECSGVIVTTPPREAARMLHAVSPFASSLISRIRNSDGIVATLAYPAGAGHPPPEGSGVLIPRAERRFLTACAWYSEKWEHARPKDDSLILRCFITEEPRTREMSDEEIVQSAAADAGRLLNLAGPPRASVVTRWDEALPIYEVGHLTRVTQIEGALSQLPCLKLAGAPYRGSGLPDCIEQGRAAAREIAAALG